MGANMVSSYNTHLFLDESGDCSCGASSKSRHFCLTILSIAEQDTKAIKARFRTRVKKLVRAGWDKSKEVKAHSLHRDPQFGAKAALGMLEYLAGIDSLRISYLVVNKNKITSQSLRDAEYGIRYNYFSGALLSELVFEDGLSSIYLTYDLRNKETHQGRKFKEYLKTKLLEESVKRDAAVEFDAVGCESNQCYGLLAVDFFSWALFRRFEYDDSRFARKFEGKVLRRREWYIGK